VRNEERRERLKLMELQKQTPPPMSGLQLYQTLEGAGFLFDSDQKIRRMRELREAVQQEAEQKKANQNCAGQKQTGQGETEPDTKDQDQQKPEQFAGKKRILVTGCPIGGVLQKTVKTMEESDAVVVCFENCSGIKAAFQMVDTEAALS
jgi:benzoyl-CoA reductase/2-hydroxyglutaryl-CoA dehydratase subunit BcrC/BadD/HgdB